MPSTSGAVVLPYPLQDGTGPDNVPADLKALADALSQQVASFKQGSRASNQPGTPRRLLLDGSVLYVDDGAQWLRAVPDTDLSGLATVSQLTTGLQGRLGATAKAADSDRLDGIDSGGFVRSPDGRQMQAAWTVVRTDAQGLAKVPFPVPFATNAASVVVSHGDFNNSGDIALSVGFLAADYFEVAAYKLADRVRVANLPVRVNWIAVGA